MKRSWSLVVLGTFLLSLALVVAQGNNSKANYTFDELSSEQSVEVINEFMSMSEEEREIILEEYAQMNSSKKTEFLEKVKNSNEEQRREIVSEFANGSLGKRVSENLRVRLKNEGELNLLRNRIQVRLIDSEMLELKQENKTIRTRLNLSEDETGEQLKAMLSNGRNAQIKIMPETANERALERLRLKVCSEENNCTIELKEIGTGENARAVYETNAEKTYRVLGLFKNKEEVMNQIDAESGDEVITTKKPWWTWMASESEE